VKNAHLPDHDTRPWYGQFWPWFLILLPGSVVCASLATFYLASRYADDLVVDDYYRDGLAINRVLEKQERARQQGIEATLAFSDTTVTVTTSGAVTAPHLQLLLSHPMESEQDFAVPLARIGPGLYRGSLPHSVAPRWHWILQLPDATDWRLDGSLQAADFGHAALD
jgi:hypothetical protein